MVNPVLTVVAVLCLAPWVAGEDATPAAETPSGTTAVPAVETIAYDEVTLNGDRVLDGHLSDDRKTLQLIELKTGKAIGSMTINPDDIVAVTPKALTVAKAVDPDAGVAAKDKPLRQAERKARTAVANLNAAKQQYADAQQADIDYDRTEGAPSGTVFHDKAAWQASMDRLAAIKKRMAEDQKQITVCQKAYDDAVADYKALGGTHDFSKDLKQPAAPK